MAQTQESIGLDNKPAALRDAVDLNHEIAGVDVGRIQRFLTGDVLDIRGETSEKKKREREMTMLLYLLENDAQYRQKYFELQDKLNKAQQAVNGVLIDINQRLAGSDRNLQDLRDNAAELGDGTKIFQSSDGSIYTEDGQRLSDDKARNILIPDGATSWEEYQAERARRAALLKQRQDIDDYQRNVLDRVQTRLQDQDNPITDGEFDDLTKAIEDRMPDTARDLHTQEAKKTSPDINRTSAAQEIDGEADLSVIDLSKSFNNVREDIPDLSRVAATPSVTSAPRLV